jgi:asparagine synthetase B (glutamine-hydrolysing)
MCGIFGILANETNIFNRNLVKLTTKKLFQYSQSRGQEAAGLAVHSISKVLLYKQALKPSELVETSPYQKFIEQYFDSLANHPTDFPYVLIGHSRLATNGLETNNDNNQPVNFQGVTGVHNGIIVNDEEIWNQYAFLNRQSELDTEILIKIIGHQVRENKEPIKAVQKAFSLIEGAASLGLIFDQYQKLVLATNTGSLYLCQSQESSICLFASEHLILSNVLQNAFISKAIGKYKITHIKANTALEISYHDFSMTSFNLPQSNLYELKGNQRSIFRIGVNLENSIFKTQSKILRRCKRCVLPETIPFIKFDSEGICNFCHSYQPMKVKGKQALENALAPYRKNNGEPDCIVGFSGGRDSSYGLHYLKKELGMNPLAITYDWGMVTDLARRNQARITGKLGIEHILVSANIKYKRENIAKNIKAWLKKTELGMIPLFMAGDKQFFYHANRVGRQNNIKLVIFLVNPLEYTEFKTGFAGLESVKYYDISLIKKLILAKYYLSNFIKNPDYFNRSLIDTCKAFISSYFMPHNFLMLYEYILWDENIINETLIKEYNWETAQDTKSTWRIGDGTASFYNYIYWTVAGFTENDTFRSNQIREGILNRDEALTLVEQENQPRYQSIAEYFSLVGVDFEQTIKIIDSIPKLY